ncbi:S-layer homology domain-containing protein [Gorillibacterium sp. sgz500922]|uniref:S-layer homology domain-containing protein n=1 Tax=Gorillibacterium sp. sgz500922 TaxID=3446694 RepID=UPI003F6706B0
MTLLLEKANVFTIHFKIKETAISSNSYVNIVKNTGATDPAGTYFDGMEEAYLPIPQLTPGKVSVVPVPKNVTVGIGSVSGVAGETVTVPVSILETAGAVAGYGMQLDYDPTALEVISIVGKSGDLFKSNKDNTEGWLRVAWTDLTGGDHALAKGDELFSVDFRIKDNPTKGDKGITVNHQEDVNYLTLVDNNLVEMIKTVSPGKVTVNELTNAEKPTISTQPQDMTVNVNEAASLSVTAKVDSGNLSYQWYSSTTNSNETGTEIADATKATFSAPTGKAGTSYYYVVVTNTDTSKTGQKTAETKSAVATVTVNELTHAEKPTISAQPQDMTVNVNEAASLSVTAKVDSGNLSYQWYSSTTNSNETGQPIPDATKATFSAPTGKAGTAYYYVVVTNTDTSKTGQKTAETKSAVATVTVNELTNAEKPTISAQPQDVTVNVNEAASLSVTAKVDSGTLSYQWYSSTTNSNETGTEIAGATKATFSAPTNKNGVFYYYVVVTNTDSTKTGQKTAETKSSVATVTVNELTNAEKPTISAQPQDVTVNVNEAASLNVTAKVDSGTLSYQWYSSTTNSNEIGTEIAGATKADFSAPTGKAGTSYYYVVVTNTDTTKTGQKTAETKSAVATVTVNELTHAEKPTISAQPQDMTVNVNEAASLSVTAKVDSGNLSYQWYSSTTNSNETGQPIPDATKATFSAPTNKNGVFYYYVVVTNTDSSKTGQQTAETKSSVATVTVNELTNAEKPTISTQPQDVTVNVNEAASLSVTAKVDSGNLSYQWYSSTTNSNETGTEVAGATKATFSAPTTKAGTAYYYVVVTNTDSTKTGQQTAETKSAVATVTVNALTHAEKPTISAQPQDMTVNVNEAASLSVTAKVDSGNLSYQWYSSTINSNETGQPIPDATKATFSAPTGKAGTAYYYVVVTNTDTSKTGQKTAETKSSVATVTVNELTNAEKPTISTQPQGVTVNVNEAASLSVTAKVDSGNLSYQWYSSTTNSNETGQPIPDATKATFSAPTNKNGVFYYYVVVTNTDSTKTGQKTAETKSAVATVTVNELTNAEKPTISTQPQDVTVNVNEAASLNVTAKVDSGTLSYQWYSSTTNSNETGQPIPDATKATFSAPTNKNGVFYYYVVVTNTDTSKTGQKTAETKSSVATVTVNALTHAEKPTISAQPQDMTVNVNEAASLSVTAKVDSGNLSYQWYSSTTNSNETGTEIAGATKATFSAPTNKNGVFYYYVVVTNTDTTKTGQKTSETKSTVATVTVNELTNAEKPTISAQPQDVTVNTNEAASLSVTAKVNSGTLSYQWYSSTTNSNETGTEIAGATKDTFSAPTGKAGTSYYYVVVTNTDTSKTGQKTSETKSSVATVTVNELTHAEKPTISAQPQDVTVNVNEAASLSVTAKVDSGTLSYQWYSSTTNSNETGTEIANATKATFPAPTGKAGTSYYYVVVTNTDTTKTGQKTAETKSSVATVTVNELTHAEKPTISAQPQDMTVNVNEAASLSVTAKVDSGTLSYQWYSSTTNSNETGTEIANATKATFPAPTGKAGTSYYYVVVTNTDTSKTGQKTAETKSAVATVTVNELTNAEAPVITSQPQDRTVNVGGTADLSVTATVGSGKLSYQWYSNTTNSTTGGTELSGVTGATYSAPTATVGTSYYYVLVTNTDSSKTGQKTAETKSSVATVTVNDLTNAEAPAITAQPQDRTVNVGGTADLSVTATVSSGNLSYQWYSNTANSTTGGTELIGVTDATYSAPTDSIGTTYYYVVVTNTDTSKTGQQTAETKSAVAAVTVNDLTNAEAPAITAQPQDRTVNVGGTADLSVTATVSSGELSYQWYSNTTNSNANGTPLANATKAAFSAPTDKEGTIYYYVVVTNTDTSVTGEKISSVTSIAAKVTVEQSTPTSSGPNQPTSPNTGGGNIKDVGTAVETQVGDKKIITVTVDPQKLNEKLAAEGNGATITVRVTEESDVVIGELSGQMIKDMEKQQAKLVIQTDNASYTLPADQINIDAVSNQLGSEVTPKDIKVQIKIAEPSDQTIKLVQAASEEGKFNLVVPPVEFTITASFGGRTVDIAKFNAYVERTISLPEGVDPKKVTTAVVIEPDGSVRHVPTQITVVDGNYFAKINSLTNSTYTLIWHPVTFKDVERHWAKEAVNDMGSRTIIDGIGNGRFAPDQAITRAEFAAIIVRGLGLKLENRTAPFSDVKSTDWYSSYIETARSYNLINGFEDGTFRPMEKITREQAMVMLARAIKITGLSSKLQTNNGKDLLSSFLDSSQVSAWATSGVIDCLQAGMISGRNGHRLEPEALVTRAEVAVMIQRLLQKSDLI